ncbi:MAG: uracil-DNA glycosylase [Nitrososphaerales archaeon]
MPIKDSELLLNKIAKEIRVCKLCILHKGRKNAVPGEGSSNAKLVMIGEAPGSEEDEQGRPFVGRAGRLLDDVLKTVSLDRRDLFVTSVVKCRPPYNRTPRLEEIRVCNPYLKRQIDVIKPKVICLLGSIALQTFFKGSSISKARGRVIEKNQQLYFCTYHPATLYNASLRSTIYEDFKTVKELLEP